MSSNNYAAIFADSSWLPALETGTCTGTLVWWLTCKLRPPTSVPRARPPTPRLRDRYLNVPSMDSCALQLVLVLLYAQQSLPHTLADRHHHSRRSSRQLAKIIYTIACIVPLSKKQSLSRPSTLVKSQSQLCLTTREYPRTTSPVRFPIPLVPVSSSFEQT